METESEQMPSSNPTYHPLHSLRDEEEGESNAIEMAQSSTHTHTHTHKDAELSLDDNADIQSDLDTLTSLGISRMLRLLLRLVCNSNSLWLLGYLFSTVATPLLIDYIAWNGGAAKSTCLPALANSLSMCLLVLLNPSSLRKGRVRWLATTAVGVLEAFSQAIIMTGLALAGSVIYTVAYSSTTMYTAILAYLLLHKRLHLLQWLGVAFVMFGLAVVSLGAQQDGSDVVAGFFMILCGSLTHSLKYIGSEYVLANCAEPVEPELFALIVGASGSIANMIYQVIHTIPHYQELIVEPIREANGEVTMIVMSYLFLIFLGALHELCFLKVIMYIGSTSTSICKGLSSALVFVFGHAIYCRLERSQCFTWNKGLSLVIVLGGVALYAGFRSDGNNTNSSQGALVVDVEKYDVVSDQSLHHLASSDVSTEGVEISQRKHCSTPT